MGTVLRLHKEADNNIVDWTGDVNKVYGSDVIDQIIDPSGARADKEITSIPSPFARIDLAKSAFDIVATENNLEGETIYHKMVSDCLDIGEIFFNYDKLSDKIDIIVWDKDIELEKLKKSNLQEHQILGQTLRMYLEQDAETYNFDRMKKIFLLNYKGPGSPALMNIIGATSPRTLFFSSANDLSYCSEYLKSSGKDRPFDSNYSPLYARDFKYQRYLYSLRCAYGEKKFAHDFPEFNNYLQASLRHLSDEQKDELYNLDKDSIKNYPVLSFDSNDVEVLDMKLHKGTALQQTDFVSDFKINSSLCTGKIPLVLPVREGNKYKDLTYITDTWQDNYSAPFVDSKSLGERILPHTADKYPYLTISDFLTPAIIGMPYELTDNFFDAKTSDPSQNKKPSENSKEENKHKNKSFLLPLKDTFFKYFTIENLMSKMPDGKKMLEFTPVGSNSVEVKLRIPVQKGKYVEYSRIYYDGESDRDEKKNEGKVLNFKFGLGIMPLIDFAGLRAKPYYRVAFFSKNKDSKLSFAGKELCNIKSHVTRRVAGEVCGIESYVIEEDFNRIFIDIEGVKNVAIPLFKKYGTATKFTFAVDFGTTNTHIEYSVDDSSASFPFNIKAADQQMQRMHMHMDYKRDKDIYYAFEDVFVPNTVGDNDDYSFPMRTVFAESKDIDYRKQTESLADGNIPFRYEKATIPAYNKIKTDLKWSNDESQRVELYLDNIFILMRNKVMLNGGGLENTKIIWFYPVSMTRARCNMFSDIWKKLYKKYFGDNLTDNLIMMSESVAPYYYYKQKQGAKSNVVTVDIGGGTTDVFVVEDNKPKILSSFRFAANSIFGDGYNFSASGNGFVKTFKGDITGVLSANERNDLLDTFYAIEREENSNDIIAFFFSLSGNETFKGTTIPVDFLDRLAKNDKLKYVFIIFYGAILYYVANMLKAKGLEMPQTLAFSGNGSKTLKVLSTDNATVAKFASMIFEKVFEKRYEGSVLDVIFENEPKLATCKGGIAMKDNLNFDQIEELQTSLLGVDGTTFATGIKYDNIKETELDKVAAEVTKCLDFLFEINDENRNFFINSLAADAGSIRTVKEICKEDLVEYTKQGLAKKIEELKSWGANEENEIEETLFFYPFVAMLSNLARKLS